MTTEEAIEILKTRNRAKQLDTYEQLISSKVDMVNHPPHYNQGEVECIDAIRSALGEEGFKAYCRGNAMKYIWRAPHKGTFKQDMDKAAWYLARAGE